MANARDAAITIGINRLSHDVVMSVTVAMTRQFRLRVWLALKLIRLATWILGCGLKVED